MTANEAGVTLDIDGQRRTFGYPELGPGQVQVEFGRPPGPVAAEDLAGDEAAGDSDYLPSDGELDDGELDEDDELDEAELGEDHELGEGERDGH